MITRELREVEQSVMVCYCDRCGKECPKLDNMLSGDSGFDGGVPRITRRIGREAWALGQPHSDDEKFLCVECIGDLREWLGLDREIPHG